MTAFWGRPSLLASYEADKEQATLDVVARFARGNTSVQNGQLMDEHDLEELSERGDQALAELDKLRERA